jgi:hypothetical protein
MAVKLTRTETIYTLDVATKVVFVDEYNTDYFCVPTVARACFADGEFDSLEFDGDDSDGSPTTVFLRDLKHLGRHHRAVVDAILSACKEA